MRTVMRMKHPFVALCLVGCAGAPPPVSSSSSPAARPRAVPTFEEAWAYKPQRYMSESSFRESLYTPDLVLLFNDHQFDGELVALSPKTGAVMWERNAVGVAHPRDRAEPLWIADDPANTDHRELVRLDPRTGAELARVALDRPISSLHDRLAWGDGNVLAFDYDHLRAIDPSTGATVWTVKVPSDAYLRPPVRFGDAIVLQSSEYLAIDVHDGGVRWRMPGACCAAMASPNGRTLYVQQGPERVVRVDGNGAARNEVAGKLVAVSDAFVAVREGERLVLHRHGDPRIAWEHHGETGGVALDGDILAFYAKSEATVWRVDLAGGTKSKVMAATSRLVVTTETGLVEAEPYINEVAIAAPYVFVDHWGVVAHRGR